MKQQLKKIFKTSVFFLLLFYFSSIITIILPFDFTSLTDKQVVIFNFSCNIIFFILIVTAYYKDLKKDFKSFFKDFTSNFEIAFKYWFVGFLIMIGSNLIITFITNGGIASNEESIRELIGIAPLYMVFSVSIYAPFTEELVFRKGFREVFSSKWIFILISGITFGSLHVLGSVTSPLDLLFLIPYCSLGITFAYTYYKTNNIFSTITMHMLHNTMALVLYLIGSVI